MSKDVIVYTKRDATPKPSEALDILLLSTDGEKPIKTYRSLEEVSEDYPAAIPATQPPKIYRKAKALFEQPNTLATTLIRKVKIVGIEKPASPADMVTAIEALRQNDDEWYIILTDNDEDTFLKAIAAWAEATEPTEAQLGAGIEDHRKFYIAQTNNREIGITNARVTIIYTDKLDEEADAAYLGNVGPFYPQSVTWKFKTPDGLTLPDLTEAQKDALEEVSINFLAKEYKRTYIKNGVCTNGEFIDVVLGADYITQFMREALYDVFQENPKVGFTDAGFTTVASAVFLALNRATSLGIIAEDPESKMGIYTVVVPKRADVSKEDALARKMPDIEWEAQLEGAVHGVKTKGVLRATL